MKRTETTIIAAPSSAEPEAAIAVRMNDRHDEERARANIRSAVRP